MHLHTREERSGITFLSSRFVNVIKNQEGSPQGGTSEIHPPNSIADRAKRGRMNDYCDAYKKQISKQFLESMPSKFAALFLKSILPFVSYEVIF